LRVYLFDLLQREVFFFLIYKFIIIKGLGAFIVILKIIILSEKY